MLEGKCGSVDNKQEVTLGSAVGLFWLKWQTARSRSGVNDVTVVQTGPVCVCLSKFVRMCVCSQRFKHTVHVSPCECV